MNWINPPMLLRVFYGSDVIWNIPSKEKIIYLTFDDGPEPEVTPQVLPVLKTYNAKATFFCVGANVKKHPGIYKQILDEDHMSGNHSLNHLNGWKTSKDNYTADIDKSSELIDSKMFRPPYGKIKPGQIKALKRNYKIILWSVLSYDFHAKVSKEKCLENVIKYTNSGSIVVFHDSIKASEKVLFALPRMLDYFSQKGYHFNSIPVH